MLALCGNYPAGPTGGCGTALQVLGGEGGGLLLVVGCFSSSSSSTGVGSVISGDSEARDTGAVVLRMSWRRFEL